MFILGPYIYIRFFKKNSILLSYQIVLYFTPVKLNTDKIINLLYLSIYRILTNGVSTVVIKSKHTKLIKT